MNSNEYVKFMTKTIVQYIDQPREERKQQRLMKKQTKEPFLYKWFGLIPYAILFMLKRNKEKK
ncbi:YqzE family protein [Bacillus aquiflavi]|uniref:YqzE family protein n=1 Tax=Bacillus aquiflavi TaxID=2672567 RepID=A0A6B3VV76_9BACI|nr:YqzE family protein [Bacillus aquiflavi]MBA4535799.1 YqzE family protein [Bacillus aquiflavi]NEY80175.1 YqzE family protein [Bacillus aquiflavi]UAC47226.1 YqzE family protein [Bacillus aquiflavi]